MAMFQSILPQNTRPESATLPPGLLAMLPRGATQSLAQDMVTASPFGPGGGQGYAPGQRPLGSSVPGAPNGPAVSAPVAPEVSTPAPQLPLVSPMDAALQAGGAGAAAAPVYDSPLATLASSLLAGINSGGRAFRAQKQANKEAEYAQSLKQGEKDSWQSYVNNSENFPGLDGKQLQATLKGMPMEKGMELMSKEGMWKSDIVAFGTDGLMNNKTGTVLREPTKKAEVWTKDQATPALDPITHQPVMNADGTPKMVYPAGRSGPIDRVAPAYMEKLISLFGMKAGETPTDEQLKLTDAAMRYDELRKANAGRATAGDVKGAAISKALIERFGPKTDKAEAEATVLPHLWRAQNLLNESDPTKIVNSGAFADIKQRWDRITGSERAERTQEYVAEIMATVFPSLKSLIGAQFTKAEVEMLMKTNGADPSQQLNTLKYIVGNHITASEESIQAHNASLARSLPGNEDAIGAFFVPMPKKPGEAPAGGGPAGAAPPPPGGFVKNQPYPSKKSPTGYIITSDGVTWTEAPAPKGGK